jgi:integrase
VSRNRAGDERVQGRLRRLEGRFRLDPALDEPGAINPADVIEPVFAEWDTEVAADTISEQAIRGYKTASREFVNAVTSRAVDPRDAMSDIVPDDVRWWISAPYPGQEEPPPLSSRKQRLTGVRAFFITAALLGLYDENPAAAVELPGKSGRYVHPLTDGQIEQLWTTARVSLDETQLPAILGLTVLGANLGECATCRVADIDLVNRRVWVHGGGQRSFDRWLAIDDDKAFDGIERRIKWLRAHYGDAADTMPLCYVASTRRPKAARNGQGALYGEQSAIAERLRFLMKTARVYTAGVTRPESIREWLANAVYQETGRVEAVAYRLGMASLDGAAHVLGLDWRELLTPPGGVR